MGILPRENHCPEFWLVIPLLFFVVWHICWYVQTTCSWVLNVLRGYKWNHWILLQRDFFFFLLSIISCDASNWMCILFFFTAVWYFLHHLFLKNVRKKIGSKVYIFSICCLQELLFIFIFWFSFLLPLEKKNNILFISAQRELRLFGSVMYEVPETQVNEGIHPRLQKSCLWAFSSCLHFIPPPKKEELTSCHSLVTSLFFRNNSSIYWKRDCV